MQQGNIELITQTSCSVSLFIPQLLLTPSKLLGLSTLTFYVPLYVFRCLPSVPVNNTALSKSTYSERTEHTMRTTVLHANLRIFSLVRGENSHQIKEQVDPGDKASSIRSESTRFEPQQRQWTSRK